MSAIASVSESGVGVWCRSLVPESGGVGIWDGRRLNGALSPAQPMMLGTVVRDDNFEPLSLEDQADQPPDGLIVVDDQQLMRHGGYYSAAHRIAGVHFSTGVEVLFVSGLLHKGSGDDRHGYGAGRA